MPQKYFIKYLLFLLLTLAVFSLATLPFNALQPDDASMYALTIKNTVQHNQWLMPLLQPGDATSFLDKPLLGIWLQALPLIFIPINEITVHIPNAIYYLVLLGVFYFFLKKEKGVEFALVGTFVLATSLAVLVFSRSPKLDILLTLAVTLAQFYLYQFWKNQNTWKYFCFSVGIGFLIKSGFAVIFCGLTVAGLLIADSDFRKKIFKFLASRQFYVGILYFLVPVVVGLGLPYFAAPSLYGDYLKSILWQSKYNLSYLGLGMHWSVFGYLIAAFFPWFIFLLNFKWIREMDSQKKSLVFFSVMWAVSNILFLFFFYQQNDLRTFVSLMPPLAVLVTTGLVSVAAKKIGARVIMLVFAVFLAGYVSLLFSAGMLVQKSNPYLAWQTKIESRFSEKILFYIYRPLDRPLFMSHDQAYLDFVTGPADAYVTQADFFKNQKNYFLLTDPQSLKALKLLMHETLFTDQYSVLVWVR